MKAWFFGLQMRERWIVAVGAAVAVVIILWGFVVRPLRAEIATLRDSRRYEAAAARRRRARRRRAAVERRRRPARSGANARRHHQQHCRQRTGSVSRARERTGRAASTSPCRASRSTRSDRLARGAARHLRRRRRDGLVQQRARARPRERSSVAATGFERDEPLVMVGLGCRRVHRVHARDVPGRHGAALVRAARLHARRSHRHVVVRAARRAARSAGSRPRRCAGAFGRCRCSSAASAAERRSAHSGRLRRRRSSRPRLRGVRLSDLRGAHFVAGAREPCCPCRACAAKPASRSRSSCSRTAGRPTAVGELKLAGLETLPLIPDGSGSLLPLGDYTVTFVPAPDGCSSRRSSSTTAGRSRSSGSLDMDARAPTRSTRSSSRAPARPRRSSKG